MGTVRTYGRTLVMFTAFLSFSRHRNASDKYYAHINLAKESELPIIPTSIVKKKKDKIVCDRKLQLWQWNQCFQEALELLIMIHYKYSFL